MARCSPNSEALRAEARLLSLAGVMLLAIAFPATLVLAALALAVGSVSPLAPLAAGAMPMAMGYLVCHFGSQRMLRARAMEGPDAGESDAPPGSLRAKLLTESN